MFILEDEINEINCIARASYNNSRNIISLHQHQQICMFQHRRQLKKN